MIWPWSLRRVPAVAGRPVVHCLIMAYNRPDLLVHQVEALRRCIGEPLSIVVVNNAPKNLRRAVKAAARQLGAATLAVSQPRTDTANYSHARALQFALGHFLVSTTDLLVIVDHDMFPIKPVDVRALLADTLLIGQEQSKTGEEGRVIRYFHPGLVLMNLKALPEISAINLWPDKVEGVSCDVGGHLWDYFVAHPEVPVGLLSWRECLGGGDGLEAMTEPVPPDRFVVEFFGGAFLHYRGASDWDYRGSAFHEAKTSWLISFLGHVWSQAPDTQQIDLRRSLARALVTAAPGPS